MEIRCCCNPENLVGQLPAGLPYETREMDNGEWAYVAHSIPASLLKAGEFLLSILGLHKKGKKKKNRPKRTWRETKIDE